MNEVKNNFRITGPQSTERLLPLITTFVWANSVHVNQIIEDLKVLDFVWETTCEKRWRSFHTNAIILNKLHNTQILESKSNLAFLQKSISFRSLQTYVAASSDEVMKWALLYWAEEGNELDERTQHICGLDWWTVKVRISMLSLP